MLKGINMALHNDVFKQQIWEFFCDDLETCLTVSKLKQSGDSRFKGGLNFTACLTIFSVIEMCSGYYKGKDTNSDTVADFLTKYFSKYFNVFKDKIFSKQFYVVFRHGLSHQWSPKASAIDMNFTDNYFLKKVKTNSEEILFLNIPIFYAYTKAALKDYEDDLNRNDNLRNLFEQRYNQIVSFDYQQMRTLREKLA